MKTVVLICAVSLGLAYAIEGAEEGAFVSELFNRVQRHMHPENHLSENASKVLCSELEKELPGELFAGTNLMSGADVAAQTADHAEEIMQAIICAHNKLCRETGDKETETDIINLRYFACRFTELQPLLVCNSILPLVSDTNNWAEPTAEVLSYLLGGADDAVIEDSELLRTYINLYKDLSDRYDEDERLKRNMPSIKGPVEKLRVSVRNCIEPTLAQMPLPELEKMLENETNWRFMDILLYSVTRQPSDEAYRIYAKYYPKWDKWSTRGEIREELRLFHDRCNKHKKWNKRLKAAAYDQAKAKREYRAEVDQMKKKLSEWPLDTPEKVKEFPQLLCQAEDLNGEYPESGLFPDRFLKRIRQEAHVECKEAYWEILQRTPDEKKYSIERRIAGAFGCAFGKVMNEEDVPRVMEYMNKQRPFKLLMLIFEKKGEDPPMYRKNGTFGILEGVARARRTNIVYRFCERHEDVKDPDVRRGILGMARKLGIKDFPAPVWPR